MKIASIFHEDPHVGIFVIEENEGFVTLVEFWNTSPKDKGTIAAAKRLTQDTDVAIINADPQLSTADKFESGLKPILEASGLKIEKPVKPLRIATGRAALEALEAEKRIDTTKIEEWPSIQAALQRPEPIYNVATLALFQGLIDACFTEHTPFYGWKFPRQTSDEIIKNIIN